MFHEVISVQSVKKSFQDASRSIDVLKDVSFSVSPGETLAIVGRSGSGKSTLLSLLAGLENPDFGSIQILGKTLHKMDERQKAQFRREHIGIVFQQFHLLDHLSALENVALPLELAKRNGASQIATEALENVGLKSRVHHRPSQLSGGECQRVALARAMVMNPDLVLADEPSGSLDEETGMMVMNQLFEMQAKKKSALILVTHSEALAKRCSRQLKLEFGTAKYL